MSQGGFRSRAREQTRSNMLTWISVLEQEHKRTEASVVWSALKVELDKSKLLDAQVAARNIMYAKQRWCELKDKPRRLLAHLLADRIQHRKILSMRKEDGELTDMNEKLQIFGEYYKNLYSFSVPMHEVVNDFLDKISIPQLSEEDQQVLEEPILLAEVIQAIKSLKSTKYPGTDGLTGEFYKKLQEQLGGKASGDVFRLFG